METSKIEISKIHFPVIDSTQVYARANLAMVQPGMLHQITADEQTGGIGQSGRLWHSPKHANLYVTYMMTFMEKDRAVKLPLSQLSALSICQVLQAYDFTAQIKWKNDIVVKGQKISGTLVEVFEHPSHQHLQVVLFGIGININMDEAEFKSVDQPSTSMKLLAIPNQEFTINVVLDKLTAILAQNIDLYKTSGFGIFVPLLQERCAFRNERIKVSEVEGEGTVTGTCVGLDENAHLVIKTDQGVELSLKSGRIVREYNNSTAALIQLRSPTVKHQESEKESTTVEKQTTNQVYLLPL
ncbi:MAG: biotin--[acetyl-CoA-carboxylase] ligase [Pseudomonadota bacterium]|nr:biotin--[acetyl-CoA-carboxylase] ligase [Pseudomonadota bacterium]